MFSLRNKKKMIYLQVSFKHSAGSGGKLGMSFRVSVTSQKV